MGFLEQGWIALRGPTKKPYRVALTIDRQAEVSVLANNEADALKEARKAFAKSQENTTQEELKDARLTDSGVPDASRLPPAQEDAHILSIVAALGDNLTPADLNREQLTAISTALRKSYSDGYWAHKPEAIGLKEEEKKEVENADSP